jgi:arylsulfatase A-like enzyme
MSRLLLIAFILIAPPQAFGVDKPNVLFIAIDDLNDWVGCLSGHPQVKTPNIDRLGARGTLFTNAHCQAPLCNPSRTSLLTGLRPSTTGAYALDPWFRSAPQLKDIVTLPQYFAKHGYVTLSTGKILHDAYPPRDERKPGNEFDEWGYDGNNGPFPPKKFVETEAKTRLMDWGVFPGRDDEVEDYKVADWAVSRLKTLGKHKPFFLCVGFRHPHVPCYAPPRWFELYPDDASLVMPSVQADDRRDIPPFAWFLNWKVPEPRLAWLQSSNQWRPLVRAYLASVSFADSQVGRVLDALDASGLTENTIVVLWSDHGWHVGEKGITGKNTLWERSTRVPLIFAGPGVAKSARCEQPAELLDMYPTLVEMTGLPQKQGLEGHSLVPQLKDASAPRQWPAITTHGPGNHAVRDARFRYIRYADGTEELYDLKNDPNEWNNLVPGSTTPLKAELARWIPKSDAPPIPGSKTRLIELRDGKTYWQGKPIDTRAQPPAASDN